MDVKAPKTNDLLHLQAAWKSPKSSSKSSATSLDTGAAAASLPVEAGALGLAMDGVLRRGEGEPLGGG